MLTWGRGKTPTLRNVGKAGPYRHTGAFGSSWDVVAWYNDAVGAHGFSGTRAAASIVPLRFSPLLAALVTTPSLP